MSTKKARLKKKASTKRRGAPVGNQNAKKGKAWADAIRYALAHEPQALNRIARALIRKAAKGSINHIKELGDRVDGKVPQGIQGPGDDGEIPVSISVTFR